MMIYYDTPCIHNTIYKQVLKTFKTLHVDVNNVGFGYYNINVLYNTG